MTGWAQAQTIQINAYGHLESGMAMAYTEVVLHDQAADFSRYFNPGSGQGTWNADVLQRVRLQAAGRLEAYGSAFMSGSYEQAAPVLLGDPARGVAGYDLIDLRLTLADSVLPAATVTLPASGDRLLFVSDRRSVRSVSLAGNSGGYPYRPLPGASALAIGGLTADRYHVDLRELVTGACCSVAPDDMPAALPITLVAPTQLEVVSFSLELMGSRNAGDAIDVAPPAKLDLGRYNLSTQVAVVYDGHFSWELDAADYASAGLYQAAQAWVDGHLGLVNVELVTTYTVDSLQASVVPEPSQWAFWLLGLAGLLSSAGWRRRNG